MVITIENNKENIKELESLGYRLSPYTKRNTPHKNLNYDEDRRVYFFSSSSYVGRKYDKYELPFRPKTYVIFI